MAFLDETGLAHFWNQILARLNKFVPAETGKGLSTNDYTTEEKTKLAGIEAGANKITVDSALSSTSTNPVQNNTINTKFDSIQTGIDNKVPNTRTVNGKALSGDITLSASDVGAVSYDTVQTLTDAQKAQARENIDSDNIYVVQLEEDGNNYTLSANTPYADMKAAYEANKTLYCRVFINNGNLILPLIRYEPSNDWWLFGIIATNQSYTIGITSDRTIGISADLVTTADLPTISTTLSSSSTDSEVPSAKCVYDELQKRNLKQATSDTLGGVKADPATADDTQPVRIDDSGKLYTAPGADGKSAYQYAQDGGYTGTETEFAVKLAQEQLTGTTSNLTPTQVYNAVSAGIPVKVQYTDSTYGLLSFTAFNVAESLNVIVSQTIVYYNNLYILAELFGDKYHNIWGFNATTLAQKTDIPEALPNPNAIIFTGAVTGSYDGSAPMSVNIPSAVTDAHINSLIDTKLGVIENGTY